MCRANNIPEVQFPESVIKKTSASREKEKGKETKKRQRSSEDKGTVEEQASKYDQYQPEYVLMPDGTWRDSKYLTPTPTHASAPTPTLWGGGGGIITNHTI